MGTWGAGNFDNDGALDFANSEVDRHIKQIENIMADAGRFCLDEDGEAVLIPRIVVLSLICEECHGVLPDDLDIGEWKSRYLAMFDEQIDELAPAPSFVSERRKTIVATFDRLAEIHDRARRRGQFWEKKRPPRP